MLYDQKINAVSILRLYLFCLCPSYDAAKLQPNTVESAQDHIETLNTATGGDLAGVPHTWYLSAQSFIRLLKFV